MLQAFAEALMSAQASMQCGAGYGERTEERENSRNGYRHRPWDTRVGTIDLAVPKLRRGVYSPEFLLDAAPAGRAGAGGGDLPGLCGGGLDPPGRRSGQGDGDRGDLAAPRSAAWPPSSTRRCAEFRDRPLDSGPYRYLWIDALTQRVREGGRVVNVSAVIATAANAEGRREIVGFDIVTTEDTAAGPSSCARLVARGLSGVELVISDAHGGIKAAIATVLGRGRLAAVPDALHGELWRRGCRKGTGR